MMNHEHFLMLFFMGGIRMTLLELEKTRDELNVSIEEVKIIEARKNKIAKFLEASKTLKPEQKVTVSIQGVQIDLLASDPLSKKIFNELEKETKAKDKEVAEMAKVVIEDVKTKVEEKLQSLFK